MTALTTLTLEAHNLNDDFMADMREAGITVVEIDSPWEVQFTAPREVLESMLRTHWDMDDDEIAEAFQHPAERITDDMLADAVKIDDLDEAVASVMDQVGITEGGVAGMVFASQEWADASEEDRLALMNEWRDQELLHRVEYK
jgi:hypothetical protein